MMGKVIAMLHQHQWRQPNQLCGERLIVEDCESVHLHIRNMRIEWTRQEFMEFAALIEQAKQQLATLSHPPHEHCYTDLAATTITSLPQCSPNAMRIELNPDIIHIHNRNFRTEYTIKEYLEYFECEFFGYHNLVRTNRTVQRIPLIDIDALDISHRLPVNDSEAKQYPLGIVCHDHEYHVQQIERLMQHIQANDIIRPIAVSPIANQPFKYKRMDGFCRYCAHKQLGLTDIECIISPYAYPGCQNDMSNILNKNDYDRILSGNWIF